MEGKTCFICIHSQSVYMYSPVSICPIAWRPHLTLLYFFTFYFFNQNFDPKFSFDFDPCSQKFRHGCEPDSKAKSWSLIPSKRWSLIPYFISNPDPWSPQNADPWSHISCQILIPDLLKTLIPDRIYYLMALPYLIPQLIYWYAHSLVFQSLCIKFPRWYI